MRFSCFSSFLKETNAIHALVSVGCLVEKEGSEKPLFDQLPASKACEQKTNPDTLLYIAFSFPSFPLTVFTDH